MRNRTKIELVVAISFIMILTSINVLSVTRTISDTQDTVDTYIRNSKGNYWAFTGDNIRTAVFDLNSTNGGTVWLPSGTIYLTKPIKMLNHVALIGSGKGITIIKVGVGFSSPANAVIYCWDTGTTIAKNNVTISDLTIEGNNSANHLVLMWKVTNFIIENVETRNSQGCGFMLGEAGEECYRGFIDNCIAYKATGAGVQGFSITNLTDCVISNLIAYGCSDQAIDFHTNKNCTINNILAYNNGYGIKFWGDPGEISGGNTVSNIFIDTTSSAVTPALRIVREYGSTFTNINVKNSNYGGIYISGVSYCNINNLNIGVTKNNAGLKIDAAIAAVSFLTITDGSVRNPTGYPSLYIVGANNLTISGMSFENAGNDNEFGNCKNVKFDKCSFNKGTYGLCPYGSSLFQITNCNFEYNSIDGIETGLSTTNSNYSITGCTFIRNQKGIDVVTGDSNVTIMCSMFKNNADDGIESDAKGIMIAFNTMWGDPFDDNSVTGAKIVEHNQGMVTV